MPIPPIPADRQADELIALYQRSARRIRTLVEVAVRRGNKGTARYFENQLRAVESELRVLARRSRPLESALTRSAYLTGVGAIDRTLRLEKAFAGVHSNALDALAKALALRLEDGRQGVGRWARDVFRRVGIEEVAIGVGAGQARRQTSRAIEQRLMEEGQTAFVDRAGRRWKLDVYAAMVARTTTREAVSQGTANRLKDHGRELVTVSSHVGSCPICLPFQGNTYSLTSDDPPYEKLEDLPPFHPNCRHVIAPASADFDAFEKALGLGPIDPEKLPDDEPEQPAGVDPDPIGTDNARDHFTFDNFQREDEEIAKQLAAIDKVHRYPASLPKAEITVKRWRNHTLGRLVTSHHQNVETGEIVKRTDEVQLNRTALRQDPPIDSTVHETGHFLDSFNFGRGELSFEQVRHNEWGSTREEVPEVAAFARAVRGSEGYARLGGDQYLSEPTELFARAYEQWIALRADNERLREKIAWVRETQPIDRYWDDDDFEPIAEALDDLFAAFGLLRSRRGGDGR